MIIHAECKHCAELVKFNLDHPDTPFACPNCETVAPMGVWWVGRVSQAWYERYASLNRRDILCHSNDVKEN